jgi:hypothetical protein
MYPAIIEASESDHVDGLIMEVDSSRNEEKLLDLFEDTVRPTIIFFENIHLKLRL